MGDEIELKLVVTSADADALEASGLLHGAPAIAKQISTYFDTPDRALSNAGFSLRIRRSAKKRIQTIKADERDFILVHFVKDEPTNSMTWKRLKFHGLTKIILTVAHLDRDSQNNDRKNLAALCQRCHLRHDIYQHISNRKYGRYHAKEHQGKLELITSPEAGAQTA